MSASLESNLFATKLISSYRHTLLTFLAQQERLDRGGCRAML
jgi:hypothetical protein